MESYFFTDISCRQQNCKRERICGDTFLFRHIEGGSRSIAVLSDGMGHGVKANILSTLTSSIIINYDYRKGSLIEMAEMVLKTLPVCSVRKTSYSTFSVVDVNQSNGQATIIEYDNPQSLIFRQGEPIDCCWDSFVMNKSSDDKRNRTIRTTTFKVSEGDRILIMSDGITQSGLGDPRHTFGWGRTNLQKFVRKAIQDNPQLSSDQLAAMVVAKAVSNDHYLTNDDVSCAVITIRKPNRILLCSCPPAFEKDHSALLESIDRFQGKKVICGYHLAQLVSRLSNRSIVKDITSLDYDVQPAWHMSGVDLVTESLVTLNKVFDMLQNNEPTKERVGPAVEVYKMLLDSDEVSIVLGTNRGNGGLYMVDEYELRRKVMKHIARILESKYRKKVRLEYI